MENPILLPQHYSLVTDGLAKYGCEFDDDIWTFTNPNRDSIADRPTLFKWPKILVEPYNLSPHYAGLLKSVAACMLVGLAGVRYSPETVKVKLTYIRRLFFGAHEKGFPKLATMTAMQAQKIIEELFLNNGEKKHCNKTIGQCLFSINLVHRLSSYTGDGFESEPFPTKVRKRILFGFRELEEWEAPPNNASFYLLRQAIKLIDTCTECLLRVYGKYVGAVDNIKAQGVTNRAAVAKYADSVISNEIFSFGPGLGQSLESLKASRQQDISTLLCHIQTACFIVITFTTAPRISEVRRARVGSISKRKHYTGREYYYYSSARSKKRYSADLESSYGDQGEDDPWVLSSAAVKAFETLTRLSAPARLASGTDNLWLVSSGDTLWPFFPKVGFNVIGVTAVNIRLNTFAKFIGLSEVTGWSGRLHSHMGRKLFARFVAMRDRSALGDLAVQYSHTSAYSVDISYAKPGIEFRRLVKDELALEMEAAVRDLVGVDSGTIYTTPSGVHQSESILRFAGEFKTNKDVLLLLGRGVKLIPCQWGACNYKQELSACEGSREEPNPSKRTPEVCSRCSNFLATPKHEIWWQQYRDDSLKWLSLSGMPDQTRHVLKLRLQQAEKVLGVIARG
ncbi:hypothetical protein HXW87_02685 [Pseudomonas sp. Y5-11]|jgi:hypothetical protein|uniref:hypothetical protein n=1 Tax=Pseudomonas TaxID=286 RepID=UPI00103DBC7B|nr:MULTISPECIES: hypothetical protein [Pseudomonas]QXE12586.1 hypothetical protein GTQ41_27290 [Pseudomonas sp. AN-B15]ULN81104.1 hypothetical protein HXW87_02685 [Pseudomonas sp. Y5-11]